MLSLKKMSRQVWRCMSEFNRVVIDADWILYGAGFAGEKRSIVAIEKQTGNEHLLANRTALWGRKKSKDDRSALDAPQTSEIGWIDQPSHPALGLTPQRLAQLLIEAESGNLTAQADLGADMEERDKNKHWEKANERAEKYIAKKQKEGEERLKAEGRKTQREEAFRIGGKALRSVIMGLLASLAKDRNWFSSI